MSFFPVKYFLKKFFPAAWFGGEDDIAGPRFANMAATMTGSGTMTGGIEASATLGCTLGGSGAMTGTVAATAALGCTMAGVGTMHGALSSTGTQEQPPVNPGVSAFGGWHSHKKADPQFADMAATISGSSAMIARIQASGSLQCTMVGRGSMTARPMTARDGLISQEPGMAGAIIDITRLLQRRREEEEMMAMILTAVG